jgi:hypothetical protein
MYVNVLTYLTGTNQPESTAESDTTCTCIYTSAGSPGMIAQDISTPPSHTFMKTAVSDVDSKLTEAALMQETAALLASLSDVILSPAKTPTCKMDISQQSYEVYNQSEVHVQLNTH